MQNIAQQAGGYFMLLLASVTLFAGCTPPGPRALLKGERLIAEEKYPEAAAELRLAVQLLGTNAQAWNYLGIACHHSGEAAEAEKAYQKALALDRDLTEAHYNLGALSLEQNRLDRAKAEFMACTLRRADFTNAFLKLGAVHLRLRETTAAERAFAEALKLSTNIAEAYNGLGVARIQRNRPTEAATYFKQALKLDPKYAPALLNLAVVSHQHLQDRAAAIRFYDDYLTLEPLSRDAAAIQAAFRQLGHSTSVKPSGSFAPLSDPPAPLPASNRSVVTSTVVPPKGPDIKVQVVRKEPVSKTGGEAGASFPRYTYRNPAKPRSGNRSAAQRSFSQGFHAQQTNRLSAALQAYRAATQLDPAYYEAHYNLGLTAGAAGNVSEALAAYEHALVIRPDSLDARYNFALLLNQAGYPLDAAAELRTLLPRYPTEVRLHLALANLCAQQLKLPSEARDHYRRVLELNPRHSQAAAIQSWLMANPK